MNEEQNKTPVWLKRTQENSWEAEILLSGLVLFALLQIPKYLDKLQHLVDIKLSNPTLYLIPFEMFALAMQVLISGFIIHLIFRGIWVGMVGLSFVFPEGSDISQLKLARKYKNHLHRLPTPVQAILKIERICSLIFSSAFLLFGYVISLMIFFTLIAVLGELAGDYLFFKYLLLVYFIFGFIYFIDFLTGGLIKRIRWLAPVYYPVYRFYSFLALSFLYRNIYYTIITNIKKWKIYVGALVYIVAFSLVSTMTSIKENKINTQSSLLTSLYTTNMKHANAYENLRQDQYIKKASIQADVIQEDYLRLFIVHKASFDEKLGIESDEDTRDKNSYKTINQQFNKLYRIEIDDSVYNNVSWSFYVHPQTNEPGISTILDISWICQGRHNLNISLPEAEKEEESLNITVRSNMEAEDDPEIRRANSQIIDKTKQDSEDDYVTIPFYKL